MRTLTEQSSQADWIDGIIEADRKLSEAQFNEMSARCDYENLIKRFCEQCEKGNLKVENGVPLIVERKYSVYVITFNLHRTLEKERVVVAMGYRIEDRMEYVQQSPEMAATRLEA